MSDVIHRTDRDSNGSLIHRLSVNTPDYPLSFWVVNPDLSVVSGVPPLYWKVVVDSVLEMNQSEKDAADEEYAHQDPEFPGEGVAVEALATAGADGQVPTANGSGGLTMKDAGGGGVFGTEVNLAEDLSTSSSTNFTPKEKLRMPSSGDITLPAGTYELSVNYTWQLDNASGRMVINVLQDGTIIGEAPSYDHSHTRAVEGARLFTRVLTAGGHNFSVEFSQFSGTTAFISDVQMRLWRIL